MTQKIHIFENFSSYNISLERKRWHFNNLNKILWCLNIYFCALFTKRVYLIIRYATPCQNFALTKIRILINFDTVTFDRKILDCNKKTLSKSSSLMKQLNYHFQALSIDTVYLMFSSPGFRCLKAGKLSSEVQWETSMKENIKSIEEYEKINLGAFQVNFENFVVI